MPTATVIAFPTTNVADLSVSNYFTAKSSLVKHWLSILNEFGREETERRLRRIVSDFIFHKTKDEKIARAYHANNGTLFNVFIDDLTCHVLQEIESTAKVNLAIK